MPGRIRHDETAWTQLSVGLTAAGIWKSLTPSKLEGLHQCDFPNGCCASGVAGCWCSSQLQTKLWKGTLGAAGASITSVPARMVGSAPVASTWAAGKEPADMDAKEGKLPLPAYWDSRNVSSIHVDREDPTDRTDERFCLNYF